MGRSTLESVGKSIMKSVFGESTPADDSSPAPDRSDEPVGGDELNGTFTGGYGMMNRGAKKAAPKAPNKKK